MMVPHASIPVIGLIVTCGSISSLRLISGTALYLKAITIGPINININTDLSAGVWGQG
jgi:hypothetical protein